jgi:hypothetical protein
MVPLDQSHPILSLPVSLFYSTATDTRAISRPWRLCRISAPAGGTMSAMVARGGGGDGSTREAAELGEFGGGAMSSRQEVKSSALAVRTTIRSRFFLSRPGRGQQTLH